MPLLPDTARRIDDAVAAAQSHGRVPALVAAVVRDGEPVHFTGAGEFTGAGQGSRPGPDTQFRIGSITKTMTAALVLALRDEGRLVLDDPLRRHLPGTPVGDVTVRQLLGHVSGLQSEPDGDWWERSAGVDLDRFLGALTPEKIAYPPHRTHHYSNLGYGLLGAALTRLTGQPWWDLVATRLLVPLGMARTTYHPTEPFARGYVVHPWHDTLREEPRHDAGAMAPAGQLWSTTDDLLRWATFLAQPEPSVLTPATLAEMCVPVVISDLDSWTAGHGLGLQLWRRGERVYVGHTGSMPGYLAVLAVHRPSRTGVVAFANAYTLHGGHIGELGLDLLTAVLDAEPARPAPWRPGTEPGTAPGAEPPADVLPLTGRWWWMGREFQASWDAATGELVLTSVPEHGQAWRFTREGPDRWRCHAGSNEGEVLLVRREADAVAALDIATFVFTRDAWPAR
ncbi:beta-lactamase family protein [Planosporangium flavigriseum]|uniref:Serine hydrolase n=1 Tax=Planosporangium flavigriseum TaxID=373681 RepID=A0A8J3PKX0_9ACTN|nr:serine hydrolase domain-containing protein [Planosporangium flavigriseum]NJC65382.1 beta-lactamase family protein [Planosporangium flavigriseum]GIG73262.1 serine hydrolase [Planosporangium flavigriseum]